MKQITKTLILLLVVLVGATSCGKDEPDGKWENMKWKIPSGVIQLDSNSFIVPTSGGSFTFVCENYEPWIATITEREGYTSVEYVVQKQNSHYFEEKWGSVKCEKKNVTITFTPIDEDDVRELEVTLTAGDLFHTFVFLQHDWLH